MKIRLTLASVAILLAGTALAQPAADTIVLDVQYTPEAAAIVARTAFPVEATFSYEGDPVPARRAQADEMTDTIDLGFGRARLPRTAGQHRVPLTGLNRARLSWVREPQMSVNVIQVLTQAQIARSTVGTTVICHGPSRLSIAEARRAPVPVICRSFRETR